jgi:membrane protein required for colicin V production
VNWVDGAVLGVLAVSGLLGLSRGLVREMLGLGAWVLAGLAALRFHGEATPLMTRLLGDPEAAEPAGYLVVFLVVLIVLSLLANLVGRLIRVSALGGLDRTLGLLFGLARGAVLLFAAYLAAGMAMPPASWPLPVREARSMPLIYDGAAALAARVPERYRPRVAPPPDTPVPAEALMHASPQGSVAGGAAPPPLSPAPAKP